MMNKLYNLSIRRKFAVVIIPLIVVILVFDFLQIKHKYLDYQDASRLNKAITLGIEINHVVHEIQKERSITSGYISNDGSIFGDELDAQRSSTDSTLAQFFNELDNDDLGDLVELHEEDLQLLKNYFERLDELRTQADKLELTTDQAIKYFSDINTVALNTVNELINETRDKDVTQQVHAIIYFLKSKERASIERAIGTKAFSNNEMDFDMYNRFATLVAEQQAYLDAFLTIANQESKSYYRSVVQGPDIEQVDVFRAILFQNEGLLEDPNEWYRVATVKIDALKKVEEFMSDNIQAHTDRIYSSTLRDFWLFLALDLLIGVLAFWLMSTIVTNLLENVSKLEAFTKRIIKGDLSRKVRIDTRDEIGQYAKTFNLMVSEIKKSRTALEKQRDRANYLYKNIYRVSKVVFENIHQGIFLLDREFKISKFYSKAMENIFGHQDIAGENFASFMRPLILPRELEALEMFMKHLFNSDMDEDVVNQLNPIEQVKIYTDNDGTVSTKYVRVNFTRIIQKGRIQNVMVTVSDETESILLQQHLEEAEKKKKKESEQVLSILKIDPAVLRGFIHNSKKTLRAISERYERDEEDNYNNLLDYTFETIHNLKSNALIIGLELMGVKFNEIEESIVLLKDRKVNAKDFLTILYEIDEADKMLEDMNEMLRKIASIYNNFPSEDGAASNIMLVDTLEKGAEMISKDLGKSVDFSFVNDNDVVIPERYMEPFKDIMIQLIRNSLAHGIDTPEKREKSGKEPTGKIQVHLEQLGDDQIEIRYEDDGNGLDLEKIKNKAVQRGILTETAAEKLDDQAIVDLIFKNDFSVSDKADKHSGRGQGMNLIKSLIEEHNGTFKVDYDEGEYFEMIIRLPLEVEDKEVV